MEITRVLIRAAASSLALAVVAILPSAAHAGAFAPAQSAAVDALVGGALAEARAPSASVAIVLGGKVVFAKAYGQRRLDPPEPAAVGTRYRIASISKQFTAAAVLMLADQGRLSLDDPVSKYLPEIGAANPATIRQALSHTAGFPEFWRVDYLPLAQRTPVAPEAIVERWGARHPDYAPGTKWSYSNTDYVILGRVVERVSGEPLMAFLTEHIFRPLDMTSAEDAFGRPLGSVDATGYERAGLGPPRPAGIAARGWGFGCGELAMTASDLARWDIGVIEQRLMSRAAYAAFEREVRLPDGGGTGYGLGVFVDTVRGHRRLRHNGQLPGFWGENRVYPDDGAAIVVLVNGSYGESPENLIADGIEKILMPSKAAPSSAPASAEQIAGALVQQIVKGKLDRTRLTADASAYLSGAVLADYHRTFQMLGPTLASRQIRSDSTGGVESRSWLLVWPTAKLVVSLQVRPDGKVEEFLAIPVWERDDPIPAPPR